MRFFLALLLPLSTFSFALGLTQPLMRFERLYFLEDRPTLIEMVQGLWLEETRRSRQSSGCSPSAFRQ